MVFYPRILCELIPALHWCYIEVTLGQCYPCVSTVKENNSTAQASSEAIVYLNLNIFPHQQLNIATKMLFYRFCNSNKHPTFKRWQVWWCWRCWRVVIVALVHQTHVVLGQVKRGADSKVLKGISTLHPHHKGYNNKQLEINTHITHQHMIHKSI